MLFCQYGHFLSNVGWEPSKRNIYPRFWPEQWRCGGVHGKAFSQFHLCMLLQSQQFISSKYLFSSQLLSITFDQVLFDVSFTPWKWAITSVFGIVPLAGILSFLAFTYIIKPLFIWGRNRRWFQRWEVSSQETATVSDDEDKKEEKTSVDVST